QIAGRAGRWIYDGTFGALSPLELPVGTVHAIESHAFPAVRRVQWRSDDLDFSSVAALRASLAEPPTRGILRHAAGAEDAASLALLAGREEIALRATRPETVRLLWDVCTIPDFRKLMLEVHVDFLEQLFIEIADRGRVRDEWVARHVREIERDSRGGSPHEVEDLVARIASVRTWTYIANRSSFLESAEEWQERTRQLEDRLSDALHERLVLRFVDAKKAARPRTRAVTKRVREESAPELDTRSTDPGHPFAKLAALRAGLAPGAQARPTRPGSPTWVEEIVDANHEAFALDASGRVVYRTSERVVGQIVRGGSIALPDVRLAYVDELGAGDRSRLLRRLLAFARDAVADLLGGIGALSTTRASAPLRAFVHRLEQGLGTALEQDLDDVLDVLDARDRTLLEDSGVRFGAGAVYLPHGLTTTAIEARTALAAAWFRTGRALAPPHGGAVSFAPSRGIDRRACLAIGYPVVGPRAIRADVLDRVFDRVRRSTPEEPADDAKLASWIGTSKSELRKVLASANRFENASQA
ncbi:MAG TPA: helicase, partial [Labilithrix sp.]|nr:helicase [Labilithrix sp.]